jgi:hypothetical protein
LIQTYAVTGAAFAAGVAPIKDARLGFHLALNPAQIEPTERSAIIDKLRAAITTLQ